MATPAYTIGEVLNYILIAIQDILGEVAKVIAENASIIATVVVLGGLGLILWRYGGRIFAGIAGWFRRMF